MISPAKHEANIRKAIILSARCMMVGLEAVKREQTSVVRFFAALSERGDHGTISRLAHNLGVRPQSIYAMLGGSKKIGEVDAGRIARIKI